MDNELLLSAITFAKNWQKSVSDNHAKVNATNGKIWTDGYKRLSVVEALKCYLISPNLKVGPAQFFQEAQSDAITSQLLASTGMWRSSLVMLRSFLENVVRTAYYMDHPIEYRLRETGNHNIPLAKVLSYLTTHPEIIDMPESINGIGLLRQEYQNLSKAVHSSSQEYRMNEGADAATLWKVDPINLSKWAKHHRQVIQCTSLILICLFREKLTGMANRPLRQSLRYAVPVSKDTQIKAKLKIKILR